MLRKCQHVLLPLGVIDPDFHSIHDEKSHREKLNKELNLSHFPKHVQTLVRNLVINSWLFFADKGLFVPVKDYEYIIDTGTS